MFVEVTQKRALIGLLLFVVYQPCRAQEEASDLRLRYQEALELINAFQFDKAQTILSVTSGSRKMSIAC